MRVCVSVYQACAVYIVYAAVLTCETWDQSKELIQMANEKKNSLNGEICCIISFIINENLIKKEIDKPSISERPQKTFKISS